MRLLVLILGLLAALPSFAAEHRVAPGQGRLAAAIAGAAPGDVLILGDGAYTGSVSIDRPLTITGPKAPWWTGRDKAPSSPSTPLTWRCAVSPLSGPAPRTRIWTRA